MEQPKYLVLNPVFNEFPLNNNWVPYKYIFVNEPYIDIFNNIGWHTVKKFQVKTLNFKIDDITKYQDYKIKDISRLQ